MYDATHHATQFYAAPQHSQPAESRIFRRCCGDFRAICPKKHRRARALGKFQRMRAAEHDRFRDQIGRESGRRRASAASRRAASGSRRSSAASDPSAGVRPARPIPMSRNGPGRCRGATSAARSGRAGRPSGSASRSVWRRVRMPWSPRLSLRVTVAPARTRALGAGGDLLAEGPEVPAQDVEVGDIRRRRSSRARSTSVAWSAVTCARVLAAGEATEPVAEAAEAQDQRLAVTAAQVGDGADALALQRGQGGAADAPDDRDRLAGEELVGLGAADQPQAARLVEVGGDLGEELVVREADRGGDAELALDPALQPGEQDAGGAWCRRSVPVRSRKASSSESGSTAGVSSSIIARMARETST